MTMMMRQRLRMCSSLLRQKQLQAEKAREKSQYRGKIELKITDGERRDHTLFDMSTYSRQSRRSLTRPIRLQQVRSR